MVYRILQQPMVREDATTKYAKYLAERLNQFDFITKSILIHKFNNLIFEAEINMYSVQLFPYQIPSPCSSPSPPYKISSPSLPPSPIYQNPSLLFCGKKKESVKSENYVRRKSLLSKARLRSACMR